MLVGAERPPLLYERDRVSLASREAPVPYLLRFGRPVPFEIRDSRGTLEVSLETGKGDLLVIASSGLAALQSPGKPVSPDKSVMRLARACETQSLSAAFAALVAEWKKTNVTPGLRDVLLLAAKRL